MGDIKYNSKKYCANKCFRLSKLCRILPYSKHWKLRASESLKYLKGVNAERKVLTLLQNLFLWEERPLDRIQNEVLPKCGHVRVHECCDFHKSRNVNSSRISARTATSFPNSACDSIALLLNGCITFLWAIKHLPPCSAAEGLCFT